MEGTFKGRLVRDVNETLRFRFVAGNCRLGSDFQVLSLCFNDSLINYYLSRQLLAADFSKHELAIIGA